MTRQVLSLLAGDAIDTWVAARLRHLTSEHSLARALLLLHGALFPGGCWYSFGQPPAQQQQQQQQQAAAAQLRQEGAPAEAKAQQAQQAAAGGGGPRWRPAQPITAEGYLDPWPAPPQAEQIAERVSGGTRGACV